VAEASAEGDIPAGIEEVWKVVSDFVGVIAMMGVPVQSEGDGIGMTRTVAMGGGEITERLEAIDPEAHTTSYSIVTGPIPVKGYLSTIRLDPRGDDATHITWSGRFEPDGVSEEEAVKMIGRIYTGGVGAIQKQFAT
jgi:Polyketide cyclase / dehydrase and lipid transport